MDLISIIMPAFNSEKFIARTIESVMNQTYKNWELIIVDDGSQDNTKNICENLAKTDSRIKLYSKDNEGVSIARNYGIKQAKGKYIMFLDSDDMYSEKMIEKMYEIIQKEDVDIVRSNYYKIRNNEKIQNSEEFESKKYSNIEIKNTIIPAILKEKIHCYVWLLMIKKELITDFNRDIHIFEDFNFYIDVLLKAKSVYLMDEELYYYTADNENSLTKKNIGKNIESMILAEKIIKDTLKKYDQDIEENFIILDTRILICIINYIYHFQYKYNIGKAIKKYKEISQKENVKTMINNYSEKYGTKKENLFSTSLIKKHYCIFYMLCLIKNIKNNKKNKER